MRGPILVTCCWPGLSRLWLRGDAAGFMPALGFAAVINVALWLSLGSGERLATHWQVVIWLSLMTVWIVSTWRAYRSLSRRDPNLRGSQEEDLYIRAQAEYLRGNWFEAERLAIQLVEQASCDIEGQLLLALIYRRQKRLDEARKQLQVMARLDGAAKWTWEIEQEQKWLARLAVQDESGGVEEAEQVARSPDLARAA